MSEPADEIREVDTPHGPARVHIDRPTKGDDAGVLVLGHGAGGGIDAPDLTLLRQLTHDGWVVARVEQPWRVAGKRVAPRPATLDEGWVPVVGALRDGAGALTGRLIVGGRSAGARVACRTAVATGADAVLALSFPLHPPGRPDRTRAPEAQGVLDAGLPLRVVQGARDPFGSVSEIRCAIPGAQVVECAGTHSFTKDPQDVLAAVREWLVQLA